MKILKDGSISCEYADVTATVSLPGEVQRELILIPATSFQQSSILFGRAVIAFVLFLRVVFTVRSLIPVVCSPRAQQIPVRHR